MIKSKYDHITLTNGSDSKSEEEENSVPVEDSRPGASLSVLHCVTNISEKVQVDHWTYTEPILLVRSMGPINIRRKLEPV